MFIMANISCKWFPYMSSVNILECLKDIKKQWRIRWNSLKNTCRGCWNFGNTFNYAFWKDLHSKESSRTMISCKRNPTLQKGPRKKIENYCHIANPWSTSIFFWKTDTHMLTWNQFVEKIWYNWQTPTWFYTTKKQHNPYPPTPILNSKSSR